MSTLSPEVIDVVVAAAGAAAAVLPSTTPLVAGTPTVVAAEALPADAAGAVLAALSGSVAGSALVVVGADLVEALKSSPLGELDVAAALQPALVAAGQAFGQVVVEAGQELPVDVAVDALGGAGVVALVPLLADGTVRATYAVALSTPAAAPRTSAAPAGRRAAGLELLRDVEMEVTAVLGHTRMTVRELLSLTPGSVVELDRAAGSPADLLVNGTLIARGEVVVVDEEYGIRVTELVGPGAEAAGAA
jgi:flagellar motor switch protein FliN/FliY